MQRRGKEHSAEKLYARAARLQPGNDEAQVAAAVGRFDEDDLSASFSRLGPLVKRFPHSQSVRYHLGLLLAWTGQREQAIKEFRLAQALNPSKYTWQAIGRVPERPNRGWVQYDEEMSRAAYGVRPVLLRQFRIRSGNARSPRGMSGQGHDRR